VSLHRSHHVQKEKRCQDYSLADLQRDNLVDSGSQSWASNDQDKTTLLASMLPYHWTIASNSRILRNQWLRNLSALCEVKTQVHGRDSGLGVLSTTLHKKPYREKLRTQCLPRLRQPRTLPKGAWEEEKPCPHSFLYQPWMCHGGTGQCWETEEYIKVPAFQALRAQQVGLHKGTFPSSELVAQWLTSFTLPRR
jgi:hypothetical protein